MYQFLSVCDWVDHVWESEANFILLRVPDAQKLVVFCANEGIRIRDFSTQAQLQGCVRLTIGSNEELAALKTVLQAFGETQ